MCTQTHAPFPNETSEGVGGAGAGPRCLPTLGTACLLGSSYLQSRELPLTPFWALTLYDPVKEPSRPHGQRGPDPRGAGVGPSRGAGLRPRNSLGRHVCQPNLPHTQVEVAPLSLPRPHLCCWARRPLQDRQPAQDRQPLQDGHPLRIRHSARGQAVGA